MKKRSSSSAGNPFSVSARQFYLLAFIFMISAASSFIANDIPLYCQKDQRHYFPVLSTWFPGLFPTDRPINWQDKGNWGEHYILPPIPYHSRTIDLKNAPFLDPFDTQDIPSWRWRHWLGTDDLGRDVLAGLLHGSTISLLIGISASILAVFIGIIIGGFAGFFGDDQFRPTRAWFFSGFVAAIFLTVMALAWFDAGKLDILSLSVLFLVCSISTVILANILKRVSWFEKRIIFPSDMVTLRIIETIRSIPDLFLIIGVAAIFRRPGLMNLIFLIAFLRWPVIARYVRAEMLKVRRQDYINYALGTGLPLKRVFWRHALPNALTPVWVLAAFSVAIAILLESSLSFLGIGIPPEWVTWGSMLNLSRRSLQAWHLAVFPGMAMFAVIYYFNRLGEQLEQRIRESGTR